ncbi:Hsp20/alpha crystallin family protein [Opitutus sp. ER46]|uniref:Hsp20/alpha crystallin family protein n=1 Tax=Opitutus sp. ER46 TaxID=2161864 RepID=UPI000D3177A8|nr:Hsp20/alpha crystallin family protein [Opitutus sp. ER46]PTX91446.1 Hsp20/alpha crystallin family protein [Opitutus sp. ER46]
MSLLNTLIPSLSRSPASRPSENSTSEPTIRPAYEIKENPDAYGLTVYLPGVTKENLEITAEEGQLRVLGRRAWKRPEAWSVVYRESTDAPFELVLTHDNLIDPDKIVAELKDGILRVSLPKHEALKPRKITIA